jgi:pimeloyl-ACP methyl ester carboxylesterase
MLRGQLEPADHVVTPELPGNGARHGERSPLRVGGMTAALRAQVDAAPPYVLVALSLGGMVALDWASRHPQEVAACVLINSSFGGVSPWWHRLRPRSYPSLLRLASPGVSLQAREEGVLRLTSRRGSDPLVIRAWVELARRHPVARSNLLRQLFAAARFRVPSNPPSLPLVLLASERDALVSVRCSQALANRWRVPLRLHPDAGHDLPLDDPGWLLQELRAWRATVMQPPRN